MEKEEKLFSSQQGITLIALIITIIILLILAGITISLVVGDNGVLTQAKKASIETSKADLEEALGRAVASAEGEYATSPEFNSGKQTFYEWLKGDSGRLKENGYTIEYDGETTDEDGNQCVEGDITKEGKNNGLKFKLKGGEAILDVDVEILDETKKEDLGSEVITAKEIAENPEKYYGKKVINYKANDEDTNVYRIFYVDKENYFGDGEYTIYLKADFIRSTDLGKTDYYGHLYFEEDFSNETKIKQLNPAWSKTSVSVPDESYNSTVYTAWLSDPTVDMWAKFANNQNPSVNYAVGGPSVEMYMRSYNESHNEQINSSKMEKLDFELKFNKYVFKVGEKYAHLIPDEDNTYQNIDIDGENFEGIYGSFSNGESWALCSPVLQFDDDETECYLAVVGDNYLGNAWGNACCSGLCPLISLEPDFNLRIEN